jgi:hypothetical protein
MTTMTIPSGVGDGGVSGMGFDDTSGAIQNVRDTR